MKTLPILLLIVAVVQPKIASADASLDVLQVEVSMQGDIEINLKISNPGPDSICTRTSSDLEIQSKRLRFFIPEFRQGGVYWGITGDSEALFGGEIEGQSPNERILLVKRGETRASTFISSDSIGPAHTDIEWRIERQFFPCDEFGAIVGPPFLLRSKWIRIAD